ncbi:MAG: hypothetical protein HYZ43_15935 [Flavobacteriia bacterium]|jgi:hypothetical protein|nr:hypothetical protein [Flavobacteriia bacterium]
MNWPVIIPVGIAAIALIAFLIWRNIKDEKEFETQLKNDYTKPKHDKGDVETEEEIK